MSIPVKYCLKEPYFLWQIGKPYIASKSGRRVVRMINPKGKIKWTSYARFLMEIELGYKLSIKVDVHHIDENKLNDVISNFEIKKKEEHTRYHHLGKTKYPPKKVKCICCGQIFFYSSLQQSKRKTRIKNGWGGGAIFCSIKCKATQIHKVRRLSCLV